MSSERESQNTAKTGASDSYRIGTRRYVEYERPRCPACGSLKIYSLRSNRNGDGTVTRPSRCREPDCGCEFVVVAI